MRKQVVAKKQRAFLKWAGGKFNLVEAITGHLPQADVLVEPFVGAGSVFLNTDYSRYVLNDINADLIHLYQFLQEQLYCHSRFHHLQLRSICIHHRYSFAKI